MKKVKNTNNFTPISDVLFSDWKSCDTHTCFFVYTNIIVTLTLIVTHLFYVILP